MIFRTLQMQSRIRDWVESRLGRDAMNPHERAMRMLEEAIELAQAIGVNITQATTVLHHVYDKPVGDIAQELGGAALTLLACAESHNILLGTCAEDEMERIESLPVEKFRKRQEENARVGIGAPPSGQKDDR